MSRNGANDPVPSANLTAEQYLQFVSAEMKLKQEMEEAQAEFKTKQSLYRLHLKHGKKNLGIDLAAHAAVTARRMMDPDEAALLDKNIARYSRFRGMPIGHQGDLLADEPPISVKAAEEARFVAAQEEGQLRGAAGDTADENKYQAGTVEHQGWAKGWKIGNRFYKKGVAMGINKTKPAGRQQAGGNLEDAQAEA